MADPQIQQYAWQQLRLGASPPPTSLPNVNPLPVNPNLTSTLRGLHNASGPRGQAARGNPIYNGAGPAPLGFSSNREMQMGAIQRRLARAREAGHQVPQLMSSFGSY